MEKKLEPTLPNQDLAKAIGEDAVVRLDAGLRALAIAVSNDDQFALIVVPDQPPTLEDLLRWEHHTGELRLIFHGQADIDLNIMDQAEFDELTRVREPEFSKVLADA